MVGTLLQPPEMDWRSFTEFFEGEGAVRIMTRSANHCVVRVSVSISQRWKPKLEQTLSFLVSEGVSGSIVRDRGNISILEVRTAESLKSLLGAMKPFAYLKKKQIEAALDYLEDKITGDQLFQSMEAEFHAGKRRTAPTCPRNPLPHTRSKGLNIARSTAGRLRGKTTGA